MDLMPKANSRLNTGDVLGDFIKEKADKISECYGGYKYLCETLRKYVKPTDHALVIGAHNATLAENLYDDGYHSLVNVDSNESEVEKVASKNEAVRPEMTFVTMQMTGMTFEDESFNAVIDKGSLDACMQCPDNASSTNTQEQMSMATSLMFEHIRRILKLGGRYICVSLAQEHVTKTLMDYFSNEGWPVRAHKLTDGNSQNSNQEQQFSPSVFVFVCTKFKKMPQMTKKILEVCLDKDKATQRFESTEAVRAVIQERQHYALIRHHIQSSSHQDLEGISIVYCNRTTNEPRYTLHIVDIKRSKKLHMQYAIFIVPEGRETEWLFATDPGRLLLAEQAGFQRLLVTYLHRDNTYENMDAIQKELSSKVMELAPIGLDKKNKVPFLTIGEDLGYRKVQYRGNSEFSGAFVVEDIRSEDGAMERRLVFLATSDAVQSQIRLLKEKQKSDNKENLGTHVDHSYLPGDYQKCQVAGIAAVPHFQSLLEKRLDLLLIGLGGGNIPMFIYTHFPNVHLDVVDLDPAIVDVAKNWFGCVDDERMKLYVEDGLKFIANKAEQGTDHRYHHVIFDIDSKDQSVGMGCPPKPFVELEFLKLVKEKILHPQGLFQLNIVARNESLKDDVIQGIKSVFPTVLRRKMEQDVNEAIYAFPEKSSLRDKELKQFLRKAGLKLQQIAKTAATPLDKDINLSEMMQDLLIQ